ncbi:type I polyketide synthase [Streptomyces avidinii]|uniref:Acyl transferase domain-containing protein/phosphopantetheinyl transferase n=1 Tax=Streptomyces avidinii TaxID=1895 RepID=A0ABS4KZW1_STRAV|nr:type I polyketide synthase [Streptomyces avidinii]MBP2035567.1 acyl transferase domain-containing protein/phosphopantetheinyl transferase [Streptomyces avidinii]GGZ01535.1 polyketide synthase [Streptomyces avidinii]
MRDAQRSGPRPTDAAIVGMGAVFPGAADLAAYRRNLLAGTDSIGEVPPGRWDPEVYYDPQGAPGPVAADRFYCRRGGFIDGLAAFDPTRFGIMPAAVEGAEPDQMLALHATAEAIADAGGEARLPADRSRIGVVLGRGGFMGVATARLDQRVRTAHQLAQTLRELAPELSERRIAQVRSAFQDALGPERPDASIGLVPSFTAARTANRLDFRGPAYTLDAACASSLLAVDQAVGLLAAGRCDAVVAGAVHHCHIATLWSVFTQLRALSPSERIRPFDRRADGTLLSEGTGVVLLKRLADAQRDGDRVYAVIRGTGVAGDGRAASLMSPLVAGQVQALERAWREAGLDPRAPGALGLLEAHGTGTPVGDAAELDTLAQVFGPSGPGSGDGIGFGSVKSMLGHTMQASGMAGLIKAALAVHEGVLPPTLHLEEPHPDLARTRMRPVGAAEPWERGPQPRRAGVNAFGFGGINAHVVLEEAPRIPSPARTATPAPAPNPVPTAAPAPVPGGGRVAPVRRFLPLGDAAAPVGPAAGGDVLLIGADTPAQLATRLAAAAPVSGGDGPCRVAVVGPTPQRLALAAKAVARGRPWRGRGDVWFTPEPLGGRMAFLFPGLEPEFAPVVDDVADRLALTAPRLTRGTSLVERALDAIATGRFFARALPELGIEADVLVGHSLGEWAAMVAAGMYPQEAADTFLGSLQPGDLRVPDLVYAALGCGAPRAQAALHGLERVVVSHDNCPHQSVICGDPEQVAAVVARLRADGVLGQELPFRSGFHTPMWEPYLGQVRAAFDRLPLRPGSLPVWSATTCAPFPAAPREVRGLVVRHLLEPVRFRELTLRLYEDEGVRSFVTLGPGSLPGFVEDSLRERPHLSVSTSSPRLPGLAALGRTCAALWAEGYAPRWDLLAEARADSEADSEAEANSEAEAVGAQEPAPASAPRPAPSRGRGMRLDLGSPLVRLGEPARAALAGLLAPPTSAPTSAPAPAPTPTAPAPGGARPVLLSALDAVLADTESAARAVAEAWSTEVPRTPEAPGAPEAPAPARANHTLRLSLAALPYVRDHCVYLQPDGWPEDSDRFPVVPMTTMLELAADAARRQAPPGLAVIGYEDVRALRWLAVEPAVDVEITVRGDGPGRLRVGLGEYASVVVLLGERYGTPPAPDDTPLHEPGPAPVSAAALYRDRWMFHGPRFAGVHEVRSVGADGIHGVLRVLPDPGALLDAAGQLFGHWMQLRLPVDRLVFPATVDRIRFYGPPPAPRELVTATARIRAVQDVTVRGDIELRGPGGGVWARIEGWTYRRFGADERVWPMKFTPEVCGIGEPRPEGWCLARRRWNDPASQELVMRRYLGAAERAAYERLAPRARAPWLLGRIAAKDALRQLLWDGGAGPVFPVEVPIGNDPAGRPLAESPSTRGFRLSISHKERIAVALAHPARPVGIDVERVTGDPDALIRIALAPAELRLAERLAAHGGTGLPAALTALWCAKEAAAKAAGGGLGGRPRDWRVAGDADSGALLVTSPEGGTYPVRTAQLTDSSPADRALTGGTLAADTAPDHVVAWTAHLAASAPCPVPFPLTEARHGN